jgi:hypothetical protein
MEKHFTFQKPGNALNVTRRLSYKVAFFLRYIIVWEQQDSHEIVVINGVFIHDAR